MNYLSGLNRNKMLHPNLFYIILGVLFVLSIYNMQNMKSQYLDQGRIEIADGTEYHYYNEEKLLNAENINQVIEKYKGLDLPQQQKSIELADMQVAEAVAVVYGWEFDQIGEVTDKGFYETYAEAGNLDGESPAPIELGYAEGWKNIHGGLNTLVLVVQFLLALVLTSVYNEDEREGLDYLVKSTRHGKLKLAKLRLVNGLQIAAMLYGIALVIYLMPILFMYGPQGFGLPIQGNPAYFFSPLTITFGQQFLLDIFIGLLAVWLMTAITLLVSAFTKNLFTGYVVLIFVMAVSYFVNLDSTSKFTTYLGTFLPTGLAQTGRYYEGTVMLGIPLISLVVIGLLVFITWPKTAHVDL